LKAGLNCGHCKTGKKDEFGNIIVDTELYCKTSPVCKNWTLHTQGPKMTWEQRAKAGVDAKHFQAALAAKGGG